MAQNNRNASAAVLCIGTELSRGELVNTNATWLSAELTKLGFQVHFSLVVDDEVERISDSLTWLKERVSLVLCTGGLGPTTDDKTAEAIAKNFSESTIRNKLAEAQIKERFSQVGREPSASNFKQADLPESCAVVKNLYGSAPGFSMQWKKDADEAGGLLFAMPGVPREMKGMFADEIKPLLQSRVQCTSVQILLRTYGLPESQVGERLSGLEEEYPTLTIGYRASIPEVEVKILVTEKNSEGPDENAEMLQKARQTAEEVKAKVKERLGKYVYGEEADSFFEYVLKKLRSRGKTLALAESCTGGLASSMLTSVPGASYVFLGSIVSYANDVKEKLLGVEDELLRAHGAVSAQVAESMAVGASMALGASLTLSITGIAGPDGGSEEKPVGTVYFGVAKEGELRSEFREETLVRSEKRVFKLKERKEIQRLAVYAGMQLILDDLEKEAV